MELTALLLIMGRIVFAAFAGFGIGAIICLIMSGIWKLFTKMLSYKFVKNTDFIKSMETELTENISFHKRISELEKEVAELKARRNN
jgi:hypothetical protein